MNSLESGDFRRRRYLKVWQPQKLDKLIEGWAWPVCMSGYILGFDFCSHLVDDVHLSVKSIGIVSFVMVLVFLACYIASFISSSSPHWFWGTQICRALCNVYPVVQRPSVSLLLWAFERDTWKIYMDVSENSGTSKSSIFNRVFHYKPSILGYHHFRKQPYLNTLDSQSEAAFVVPQCVFFSLVALRIAEKKGQVWGKDRWVFMAFGQNKNSECKNRRSQTRMEYKVRLTSHISMIWEYPHLVWLTQSHVVSAGRSLFSLRAEETSGGSVALSSRKNLTRQRVAIEQQKHKKCVVGRTYVMLLMNKQDPPKMHPSIHEWLDGSGLGLLLVESLMMWCRHHAED